MFLPLQVLLATVLSGKRNSTAREGWPSRPSADGQTRGWEVGGGALESDWYIPCFYLCLLFFVASNVTFIFNMVLFFSLISSPEWISSVSFFFLFIKCYRFFKLFVCLFCRKPNYSSSLESMKNYKSEFLFARYFAF